MSDELKPCPECASDNLDLDSSCIAGLSWVICRDCDFTLQKKVPEENIWRHWNKLKKTQNPNPNPPTCLPVSGGRDQGS